MDAKALVASLKGRMRGFLEFGLFDDPAMLARELRGLRTQVTRAIVELEKLPASGAAAEPVKGGG